MIDELHEIPFEQLYTRLKGPIERYAMLLSGNKEDAEDIVQDIFMKLWVKRTEVKTEELNNYVFIMVRNHFINKVRKNKSSSRHLKQYFHYKSEVSIQDDLIVKEGLAVYKEAIGQLSAKVKLVYESKVNGFCVYEIAMQGKCSVNTVKNQLRMANVKVREHLNKKLQLNVSLDGRRKLWKPESLN